jgi:hypothetical protein
MRKFILIAGFVLASATAQAGDARSLSLSGGDPLATPVPARNTDKAVDSSQTAQAPQTTEVPKAEAPKYVERPAVVEPNNDLTGLENTKPAVTKAASAPRTEKPRRKRYWTEGRIISELHRHGIYW